MLALVVLLFAALGGDAPAEANAWIEKTEARLYTWPKPGNVVRFQVRTNLLDPLIAEFEKEPEASSDPEKSRWVASLKRATIRGTADTGTGKVSIDVALAYEPTSPSGKGASEKLKEWLSSTISKAFEGLPLHDASMLRKGGSALGAEDRGEIVVVTVSGKGAEDGSRIHLNKRSSLPESIEMKDMSLRFRFVEVMPGRFAPARLEVKGRGGKESLAEYAYQRAGELAFPSTIKMSQGATSATISFVSIQVEPR
jgi:hypothetical protein